MISNELKFVMIVDKCGKSAWNCDAYKYAKSGFALLQMLIDAQLTQVKITPYRIIYVLELWTDYELSRGLFWCLFPELCNSEGNQHQHNPRVHT